MINYVLSFDPMAKKSCEYLLFIFYFNKFEGIERILSSLCLLTKVSYTFVLCLAMVQWQHNYKNPWYTVIPVIRSVLGEAEISLLVPILPLL